MPLQNAERNQRFGEEGVAGYILDLRSNQAALLFSSVEIAQMWLGDCLNC